MLTFAQMGFGPTVTACSATPATDGYLGTIAGYEYHIHPIATPDQYAALVAAIAANQVTVEPYVAPTPPTPEQLLVQSAQAAVGAGLSIALSGSMTLAETLFPTDSVTTNKIGTVVTTINATGAFPGGATEYPMKDSTGAWHTFTVSQYKAIAAAIATYVAALDLIIDGNPLGATALPPASAALTV